MKNLKEGVEPETGIVNGTPWWICGFCMELMGEKEKNCPDKCPHCGIKIKKGDVG